MVATRLPTLLVVLLVAASGPRAASAQPAKPAKPPTTSAPPRPAPPPPAAGGSDFKREEARRHFTQGVALYEEKNYLGALAEFQAAYDTQPASPTLYNIGLTQKALFRYTEAIETLQRYMVDGVKDGKLTPERFSQVQALIEEMRSLLAPVTFVITPRDARLFVDGRPTAVPENGLVSLAAGSHVVEVVADGHEPQRRQLTVAAGVPVTHEIRLARIVRTGKVRISSSQPNTRVLVDGMDRGFAPVELELGAGGHQLQARADGFEALHTELTLAAGQERNVDLDMRRPAAPDRPVYKRWWFWTGLGAAVAGGTVAAFMLQPGTQRPLTGALGTFRVND